MKKEDDYFKKLGAKLKKGPSQKIYEHKDRNIRYWTDEKGNIHRERISVNK